MITVYHGSKTKIKNLNLDLCHFGWHAGTLLLSLDIILLESKNTDINWDLIYVYVSKIKPNKNNTLIINDVFLYDSDFFDNLKRVLRANLKILFPKNNIDSLINDSNSLSELRQILVNHNIIYIKYRNNYEAEGYSYCILDDDLDIKEYTYSELFNSHLKYK